MCWDRDNDCIYVIEAIRMRRALPAMHVERIKANPCWDAPVAWPHDGHRQNLSDGVTIANMYKKLGLFMLPKHATFKDGGHSFEAGITEMENRFATGRLKIARHLSEAWEEYRDYHREDGLVQKIDDDLMSAIRVACMQIRSAKVLETVGSGANGMRRQRGPQMASGIDFDLFE